jgi:peptidyl-prolyl cis-trans isomerase C
VKTRVIVVVAVAIAVAPALGCRKNPAEQSAAAQTPATQAKPAEPPAPPKPMPAELPDVLARVNGQAVMKADFERLLKNLEANRGPVPPDQRDRVMRGLLDQLITYNVLKQEAAARSVQVPDAEVDAKVQEMRKPFATDAEFQKALTARNTTASQLKEDARADLVINKMMEAEVANATAATEADAKDFYDKNPDRFKQPDSIRASHILIMAAENADDATKKAARAKIDGVLKRVKAGEDFAALAKEHSQDGSSAQGGDLGFFPRGQMVPPFDQAAFALKPGEISDVVTTQFGYHIIKLIERKEASTVPFDTVKPRVLEFLSNDKKQQRINALIDDAKKRAKIEVLV